MSEISAATNQQVLKYHTNNFPCCYKLFVFFIDAEISLNGTGFRNKSASLVFIMKIHKMKYFRNVYKSDIGKTYFAKLASVPSTSQPCLKILICFNR